MKSPRTGHIMKISASDRIRRDKQRKGDTLRSDAYNVSKAVFFTRAELQNDYMAAIRKRISNTINKLYSENMQLADEELNKAAIVGKLTMLQLVNRYGDKFLKSLKRVTQKTEAEYRRQLLSVAKETGMYTIQDITASSLNRFCQAHGNDYAIKCLNIASRFFIYCKDKRNISGDNPFSNYIFRHCPRKRKAISRLQVLASAHSVLSDDFEQRLFNEINNGISRDGKYLGIALIIGAGLSSRKACELVWKDILFDDDDPDFVRIVQKNDQRLGAIHDYTCPCFPCVARILHARYDSLCKTKTAGDRPVVTARGGSDKTDHATLTSFCRRVLSNIGVNKKCLDACRDGDELHVGGGVKLLLNTYRHKVGYVCGLELLDPGAFSFLLHRSLSGNTTSDNYRSFTSPEGQRYLYNALQRDSSQRVLPKCKQVESSINAQGLPKTIVHQPNVDTQAKAVMTLALRNGEMVELTSEKGLSLNIITKLKTK